MAKILVKEGDLVRIKPQYEKYYSRRVVCAVGVVEKCVKLEKPTYTQYFYMVRFTGIDKLYRVQSGALQIIRRPIGEDLFKKLYGGGASPKNTPKSASDQLLSNQLISNVNRALDEAAVRIKARAELRAKAEQDQQKNSVTVHIPYTRAFRVAENDDAVRAKLRTVHNLLLADQKVTPEQIDAIIENFDECQKMIYEIASYAVQNAKRVNK